VACPSKKREIYTLGPISPPPVHFVQAEMKEKDFVSNMNKAPDSD
jgi:hypothetical protein